MANKGSMKEHQFTWSASNRVANNAFESMWEHELLNIKINKLWELSRKCGLDLPKNISPTIEIINESSVNNHDVNWSSRSAVTVERGSDRWSSSWNIKKTTVVACTGQLKPQACKEHRVLMPGWAEITYFRNEKQYPKPKTTQINDSWIADQWDAHEKIICQWTRRVATIPRPRTKSSRRGEFRSSGFHFLLPFFDLLFLKLHSENMVPTKRNPADLDLPGRIV